MIPLEGRAGDNGSMYSTQTLGVHTLMFDINGK